MQLLFINDLPKYVQSSTARIFADDCILYRKIQNKADSKLLQEDMSNILRWQCDWQMEFHPSIWQLLYVSNKRRPSLAIHKIIKWNNHIKT